MSTIIVKTDGNEVQVWHCGWHYPSRLIEKQFPAVKGIPVTTGICVDCMNKQRIPAGFTRSAAGLTRSAT